MSYELVVAIVMLVTSVLSLLFYKQCARLTDFYMGFGRGHSEVICIISAIGGFIFGLGLLISELF